jgi:hypothetical protein
MDTTDWFSITIYEGFIISPFNQIMQGGADRGEGVQEGRGAEPRIDLNCNQPVKMQMFLRPQDRVQRHDGVGQMV